MGSEHLDMFSCLEKSDLASDIFGIIEAISGRDILAEVSIAKRLEQLEPSIRQLAIFGASLYYWNLLCTNERFSCVAGHSLGFYSAISAAGSISYEDGIRLITKVQEAIDDIRTTRQGGMASIMGLKTETINEICSSLEDIYISNINSATQIVISGPECKLEDACRIATDKGALRTIRLNVSAPLHSPLMSGIEEKIVKFSRTIDIKEPKIPVISHIDGSQLNAEGIRNTIATQLVQRVDWRAAVKAIRSSGIDRFIEIGPSDVLSKLVLWIERDVDVLTAEELTSCRI